jgi:hypothetical protein
MAGRHAHFSGTVVHLVVAASLLGGFGVAEAQDEARSGRGSVAGRVVDAVSAQPLDGATIVLQPEVVGAFPGGPAAGSAFAAATRAAASDVAGAYRFEDLPSGVYRIYVTRLGYRPYSIVVELRGAVESVVSIGLHAEPIRLPALRPVGSPRGPYEAGQGLDGEAGLARLMVADQRRRLYLTTDVRELTHNDVVEAVTLGEPDLFRALQRLPGVSTRSDYTAELWTRGAPWSHTRVYFDGMPLFNPLHALGVVSGVGSNAVGAVWFHPGARSAGIAEGAAGVVDLQSRRASGAGELNVNGDLSLMSAALALDQRVLDGRAGWMLAGRRTYLDWLTDVARRTTGREDASFPYGFAEVAGRVDAWLGERTALEASWLWEADHLTNGDASGEPMRADWGNTAVRASLTTRLGRVNLRHTVGMSDHGSVVLPAQEGLRTGMVPANPENVRRSESGIRYRSISGTFWPDPSTLAGPSWTAGWALEQHTTDYWGPIALPVPRASFAQPDALSSGGITLEGAQPTVALWGDRTWTAGDRLSVRAGLRVEAGEPLRNVGGLRPAPRLSARFAAMPEVAISGGYSRVYQYTQALAPGGVHLASLISTDVWMLASATVPAIRSDILTLGTEAILAPGRLVAVNGFARRADGLAVTDPRPGPVLHRPLWVLGENRAYGVETSVRQLMGPVTGSASYTFSRSRVEAAGLDFVAPADRPHVLNSTLMVRATPALRIGGAFTAASGVPFTRAVSSADGCAALPGCQPDRLPWLDQPNAARAPTFASLDLLFDWSARIRTADVGAFLQLRNVLGRENATVYTGGPAACQPVGCERDLDNFYERGVPRLPVIGLRVRH